MALRLAHTCHATIPSTIKTIAAPKSSEHLASARQLAKENPAAVANIVRGWVSGEAATT